MSFFVHPQGICESSTVGDGTQIWAFAHVLPGARIGENCNLNDHVFVENDVILGDRITVKSGVQLWDGVRLADDVFVGPNATFTNDPFPRSKRAPKEFLPTIVEQGASIGANATILGGVTIGRGAMVGAGAVVLRSVPAHAIVVGNPSRIVGYVDAKASPGASGESPTPSDADRQSSVGGVVLHRLPRIEDMRGAIVVGELESFLPFHVKRFFTILDVPSREIRGEHAHRECHQFFLCLRGGVSVLVDDGQVREEFRLDHPQKGLHVPPMVWAAQYAHTEDAVLLVLASHPYDPNDYIRDFEDFRRLQARGQSSG